MCRIRDPHTCRPARLYCTDIVSCVCPVCVLAAAVVAECGAQCASLPPDGRGPADDDLVGLPRPRRGGRPVDRAPLLVPRVPPAPRVARCRRGAARPLRRVQGGRCFISLPSHLSATCLRLVTGLPRHWCATWCPVWLAGIEVLLVLVAAFKVGAASSLCLVTCLPPVSASSRVCLITGVPLGTPCGSPSSRCC
jgi:hypothetical protein